MSEKNEVTSPMTPEQALAVLDSYADDIAYDDFTSHLKRKQDRGIAARAEYAEARATLAAEIARLRKEVADWKAKEAFAVSDLQRQLRHENGRAEQAERERDGLWAFLYDEKCNLNSGPFDPAALRERISRALTTQPGATK